MNKENKIDFNGNILQSNQKENNNITIKKEMYNNKKEGSIKNNNRDKKNLHNNNKEKI